MTLDLRSTTNTCEYCGLPFSGSGYSPDSKHHYCCYGCFLVQRIIGEQGEGGIASWILLRLGVGAFLAMNVMMISLVLYTNSPSELGISATHGLYWALVILSTPAMIILGGAFVSGSVKGLLEKRINMDTLIVTGAFAAYGVSTLHVVRNSGPIYFDTATMLLLIVTVGKLLEASAKSKTSIAIREMMQLSPDKACILCNGKETEVAIDEVQKSDLMVVRPGERFPADGIIRSGECMVEESAFTGESKPRSCAIGDKIYGGSINVDGFLAVEATAVGSDSLLSQIQALVYQAQHQKAPIEKIAERVSSAFVPIVWIVAGLAGLYWGVLRGNPAEAGLSALAVLVVACPCALGIATPIAACLAIGKAAQAGVLVRSGEVLERLPGISRVYFDKTGTLTTNELKVSDIFTVGDVTWEEAIAWAASLETGSEHSIARSIVAMACDKGIELGEVESFQSIPGRGATGVVRLNETTKEVAVGSIKLFADGYDIPAALAELSEPLTTCYIGLDSRIIAAVTLQDTVRASAIDTVAALRADAIRISVVSGDREAPTLRVAVTVRADDIMFECTPMDKAKAIESACKLGKVAMVGDGINDAPALAKADVGISIASGTDLAREASDVTLLGDDLSRIPWLIDLSRLTYKIIRQNLWWAFGYNSVAIILAFLGYVHPLIAAGAMVLSSLAVVANSMRIIRMAD